MAARISNSPTPNTVAEAFGQLVTERAQVVAGKDGRITAREASQDAFVQAAYQQAGVQRPSARRLGKAGADAMRAAAQAVTGGDGRVSARDAAKMPAPMGEAFTALRAKVDGQGQVAKLLAQLSRAVEGMYFLSESDDPYVPFHVAMPKDMPLTAANLKQVLTWDAEPGSEPDQYRPYPLKFELELYAEDGFWKENEAQMEESGYEPQETLRNRAVDRLMQGALAPAKATDAEGNAVEAKIFTATPREEDAARAPYYIFGRLPGGDIVGLKTWRTWT